MKVATMSTSPEGTTPNDHNRPTRGWTCRPGVITAGHPRGAFLYLDEVQVGATASKTHSM